MKRLSLLILLVGALAASCSHNPEAVLGVWNVTDPYYSASYEIAEENGKLVAVVLRYNDGTQRYTSNGTQVNYLIRDLAWRDSVYVDATTGATNTSASNSICIEPVHADTLEVHYPAGRSTTTERWIRTSQP